MNSGNISNGKRGSRGFRHAAGFTMDTVRAAGESRGFAVSKLLTRWAEIVGTDIAARSHPVKVSFGRDGLGATLTVLTDGPNAPLLEMQTEALRERINACYGYRAISRIRVTQTAPTGFAEGQISFRHPSKPEKPAEPSPEMRQRAALEAAVVSDPGLRRALETLGANVLSRPKRMNRDTQ